HHPETRRVAVAACPARTATGTAEAAEAGRDMGDPGPAIRAAGPTLAAGARRHPRNHHPGRGHAARGNLSPGPARTVRLRPAWPPPAGARPFRRTVPAAPVP